MIRSRRLPLTRARLPRKAFIGTKQRLRGAMIDHIRGSLETDMVNIQNQLRS